MFNYLVSFFIKSSYLTPLPQTFFNFNIFKFSSWLLRHYIINDYYPLVIRFSNFTKQNKRRYILHRVIPLRCPWLECCTGTGSRHRPGRQGLFRHRSVPVERSRKGPGKGRAEVGYESQGRNLRRGLTRVFQKIKRKINRK